MSRQGNTAALSAISALFVLLTGCSAAGTEAGTLPESTLEESVPPSSTPPSSTPHESALPGSAPPESAAPEPRFDSKPQATTYGDLAASPPDPAPWDVTPGMVLRVKRDLQLHEAPDGAVFATLPARQLNNPTWVPIVAEQGEWARVLLPARPNNSTGWVRMDPERTDKARTPYLVEVDVDARRMVVFRAGKEIGAWTVGVGSPDTPTPRGRTFVLASIEETVSKFSPVILPLGTHSETLNSYGGGPGTVALHGWPDPAVFGRASSDGCVRVPDDALRLLTSMPLGTLVLLR